MLSYTAPAMPESVIFGVMCKRRYSGAVVGVIWTKEASSTRTVSN